MYDTYRKTRPNASPSELYVAITTANMIGIGAVTIAERKYAQHGAPVFMYIFTHEAEGMIPGTNMKRGAPHAMEIPYKFNIVQPAGAQGGRGMMAITGPDSEKAAHNMSEMWSTFARTGHPAAKGQPAWPVYTTEKRATMEIDAAMQGRRRPVRSGAGHVGAPGPLRGRCAGMIGVKILLPQPIRNAQRLRELRTVAADKIGLDDHFSVPFATDRFT